ncbi:7556_t:CDS:2, partial [Scutellospora calospora]
EFLGCSSIHIPWVEDEKADVVSSTNGLEINYDDEDNIKEVKERSKGSFINRLKAIWFRCSCYPQKRSPHPITKSASSTQFPSLFKYIDGRRYHNYENSRYPLPNDDEEINRLQTQHYLFRYAWGGNYSSPVEEILRAGGAHVLDIGCGPATWVLEMASEYTSTSFIGIDFSLVFPTNIKPRNVQFYHMNILDGLPFEDNTFDFVYQRFMGLALTEKQWPMLLTELVRVTKPGGWIELMECDLQFDSEGPISSRVNDAAQMYLKSQGINALICPHIPQLMTDIQNITNLEKKQESTPLGRWGGLIGELARENVIGLSRSLKPVLFPILEEMFGELNLEYETIIKEIMDNEVNQYMS